MEGGPEKRTSAKYRIFVGCRSGRLEAGPKERSLWKMKIKDWSWEVGSGAQWKNLWKIKIED